MENRKVEETLLHNKLRDENLARDGTEYERLTANKKFYSIARSSENYYRRWIKERCRNKRVLDYCCGNGANAIFAAGQGAEAFGIDISDVSIENCKKSAATAGVTRRVSFLVMDAETLSFPDSYFDIIICAGVLHHLDLKRSFAELARVLKPGGQVICIEALVHNPIIHWYRKATPHLRTEWETEHILGKSDLQTAKEYFFSLDARFYHLCTILAVPLRNTPAFGTMVGIFEKIDAVILRLPLIKWWAWQVVFVLTKPRKASYV